MEKVLVDISASLTVLPEDLLESVGAPPIQPRAYLELGDKRVVEARVYAAVIGAGDKEAATIIASFEGAKPVLGVGSLEDLGLRIDPVAGGLRRRDLRIS